MALVEQRRLGGPAAATAPVSTARRPSRWPLLRRLLAAADMLVVLGVCAAVGWTTGELHGLYALASLPLWLLLAKLLGLYDRDQRALRHQTLDEFPALVSWATIGAGALATAFLATPARPLEPGLVIALWTSATAAAVALRSLTRAAWRRLTPPERTLIVGDAAAAAEIARKLDRFADAHVTVAAVRTELDPAELRDPPPELADVERILVTGSAPDEALVAELFAFCRRHQVRLALVPDARGLFTAAARLDRLADLPLVEYATWHVSRSTMLVKRTLDLALGALSLVAVAPLMAAVAIAIRLDGPGPILFRQLRAGRKGRPFTMLKFRTMVPGAEEMPAPDGLKLRDDPRVTRVGRLLRRWSLDELPQLVNVLRGDMSLVGPRPEQVDLVERYGEALRLRLEVRPGLTGPMQVYGRGSLSLEERTALDRDYIETLSLRRDLHILALTLAAIVSGRGAY